MAPPDAIIDLHFPMAGVDLGSAFDAQPNRPLPVDGTYARTTAIGTNVRAYEPRTGRSRGGARAGLARHIDATVSGDFLVQGINAIVGSGYDPPGGGVQTSQSGRIVTLVAVSDGDVKVADAGAASWASVTNGTNALNTTGIVFSAPNQQLLFFADGTHEKYYDPSDNTVKPWTLTAGTLPQDADGNRPRLICTWQGRTVLSGLLGDSQNIFFSAIGAPFNFDYNPAAPSAAQAFALNAADFGRIGNSVFSLMPFTDDVLVAGTANQIWTLQGNPADGGQLYKVSDGIGTAWGASWCADPVGQIYFVSNNVGIYRFTPTQSSPLRISMGIDTLLGAINTGATTVSLAYDDRWQGVHVFITSTAGPNANDVHFFYEARANAWWLDVFGNPDHNPLCTCTFEGNQASDRVVLLGSWSGYVMFLSEDADDDDGTPIDSEVIIGPMNTKDLDDIMFKDIQGILAEGGGPVNYRIQVGKTAEAALTNTPVVNGVWQPSRNLTKMVNRSGHALYVKIDSDNAWALEAIRCRIQGLGRVRARGR